MTFLIADDNAHMRESIKRFLVRNIPNHHTFLEAKDGSEAVTLYKRYSPDWVVMDIEMEPMDGIAALKLIHASYSAAKVVMLTSYDDVGYRKAAKEAGAYGYILKVHLDELQSIVTGTKHTHGN